VLVAQGQIQHGGYRKPAFGRQPHIRLPFNT
jgi:hypothetical protein